MKLQNIHAFLSCVVSSFGLSYDDIFEAEDLYYASNFERVVQTLALLSQHRRFIDIGLRFVTNE
jgi:hypothetical protein